MPAYQVVVCKEINIEYRHYAMLYIFKSMYTHCFTFHVTFAYVKMYATFGGGVAAATTKRVVSPRVK